MRRTRACSGGRRADRLIMRSSAAPLAGRKEAEQLPDVALSVNGTTEADDAGSSRWPDDDVILYDGVCIFCSRWVRFVAARDGAPVSLHADPVGLRHTAGASLRHRSRRSRHQCGDPWWRRLVQVRRCVDGAVGSFGIALDAGAVRRTETAARRGLFIGREKSLSNFRKDRRVFCAG